MAFDAIDPSGQTSHVCEMAIDRELAGRVERLRTGSFQVEDFTRLFLRLRDRYHGRETVCEIGDFVAHSDERIKGLVTGRARDFFKSIRLNAPPVLNINLDHDDIKRGLEARRRITGDLTLASILKIGQNKIGSILGRIISKIDSLDGQTLNINKPFTEIESQLYRVLMTRFDVKPAFTGRMVFDELRYVLEREKLIVPENLNSLSVIRESVSLYAAAAMHRCKISLKNGSFAILSMSGDESGDIIVNAAMPISGANNILFSMPIYNADVKIVDGCDDVVRELLSKDDTDTPIELRADGLLHAL